MDKYRSVRATRKIARLARRALKSALNGSHGEATETDDLKKGQRKGQSKNKNKNKQRKQRVRVQRPISQPHNIFKLGTCAKKFAIAMARPFSNEAYGACIPIAPSRPSQKVHAIQRFVMNTGVANVGFVLLSPCLANDAVNIYTTGTNFGGTDMSPVVTGALTTSTGGVTPLVCSTLPYTKADLLGSGDNNAAVSGRIVSVGIRITYAGTELNKGGWGYAYVDPDHSNLWGESIATLGSREGANVIHVSSKPIELSCGPIDAQEYAYDASQYLGPGSSSAAYTLAGCYPMSGLDYISPAAQAGPYPIGSAPIAIIINSTANNPFYVEVITHAEYIGLKCEGRTTANTCDSVGMEAVQNAQAMAQEENRQYGKPYGTRLLEFLDVTTNAANAVQSAFMTVSDSLRSTRSGRGDLRLL